MSLALELLTLRACYNGSSWPTWRPGTEREDARMELAFSVVATAAAIWILERLASGEDL